MSLVRAVLRHALPAALLTVVVMSSSTPAQSLGDLARQEQARRKAAPSGKVYTNDDLKGAPEPAASAPDASGTPSSTPAAGDARPAPPADGKSTTKTDAGDSKETGDAKSAAGEDKNKAGGADSTQDEAYWRKRQQTLQEQLDRARSFADALQSQINGLTAEFAAKDDPAQRSLVANDREKALTELERVKKEIQQHTEALASLQEEARRAGVPPGWLR